MQPGRLLIALALGAALFFSGCSSFNKEWKSAVAAKNTSSIEGAWKGEWRSESNGHHGSLRAVVTQTSPTTFRAHYRAKYMKILRYTYVANLTGHETNGVVRLVGETDLGKLAGGVYSYEATVSPTNFYSTYKNSFDHGFYRMARP